MKTDLYTKILLTVISVCFVLHILKQYEFIPSAQAATNSEIIPKGYVQDVRIVDGVGFYKSERGDKDSGWRVLDEK
jgi:hypothetical protein